MSRRKQIIAFVTNTAWNMAHFRLPLMKALRDDGFEIKAIAPWDASERKLNEEGFSLVPLHHMRRKGTNPVKEIKLIQEIKRLYVKEQVDPSYAIHHKTKYLWITCGS